MTWICGESSTNNRWGQTICILNYEHDEHVYDVACIQAKLLFGKYSIQLLKMLESIVDENVRIDSRRKWCGPAPESVV